MNHDFYDREDGLEHCRVCGGAEGDLPTECPNEKMNHIQIKLIGEDILDFKGGKWIWAKFIPTNIETNRINFMNGDFETAVTSNNSGYFAGGYLKETFKSLKSSAEFERQFAQNFEAQINNPTKSPKAKGE